MELVIITRGASGLERNSPNGCTGLDHECLLARQYFEILLDQAILHPVLANLPGFAIRDQFVWIESDIETELLSIIT